MSSVVSVPRIKCLKNWLVPAYLRGPMVYPLAIWKGVDLGGNTAKNIQWSQMPGFKETLDSVMSNEPMSLWLQNNDVKTSVVRAAPGHKWELPAGGVFFVLDGSGFWLQDCKSGSEIGLSEDAFYGVEPGGSWRLSSASNYSVITLVIFERLGARIP